MSSTRDSNPPSSYSKLPPIITSQLDRDFLKDVNNFIDSELKKVNNLDEEQRYLVYKAVFNKVIEHVTAYKPVLTRIQKEYEDTIEIIKKGQREASFLQSKLKAMASEPSTLRNYKKRADELEERIALVNKDNQRLQKEIREMQTLREDRERRPKTAETPKRQLKTDNRFIPGLTLEETTDMDVLEKKFETLDRQIRELNISLKARFLPKSHKMQLKETLDAKALYRDQLLMQTQVYKARGLKLKIALEAAQAYNQMKPPHQTVGDAVMIAFHQASRSLQDERDQSNGEQADALAQSTAVEDDDPNKEKEAEMMLEYIEKFNELFEDGLFEEAAVHAANSPKGILRTQATLAKFRDVKTKSKGRSPLLAFCDAVMSSVKAAGKKPNEALSKDCIEAGLKENRVDLVYHWLAQDRLTLTQEMGVLITEHCTCQLPCLCGCQALAQNVFVRLKAHEDVVKTMLKQGKVQCALQHARQWHCITSDNVKGILMSNVCQHLIFGLMETDHQKKKPLLNLTIGSVLLSLRDLNKPEEAADLIHAMLQKPRDKRYEKLGAILPLQRAITLDRTTSPEQWGKIIDFLSTNGQPEMSVQLQAMAIVVNILCHACTIVQDDQRKGVSFSLGVHTRFDSEDEDSSHEVSSRSWETTSRDPSSREMSPDVPLMRKSPGESILKKRVIEDGSSPDVALRKTPLPSAMKKGVRLSGFTSPPPKVAIDMQQEDQSGPKRPLSKVGGGIRLMDNDPYTSNPESAGESEAE
ncbi:unnamed protein product [Lymnaea stagnalis]|uniref:Translin-associated factor X-interacting protein 1 N-terminal domain-containing protein n=1 Tax=Lymnaea stagnalis TaxID=6523 RepID=A0AAV2IN46_LYMST